MKRTFKRFALVLSLALVVCALFVSLGAFAAGSTTPAGVTVFLNQDFDSLTIQNYGSAKETTTHPNLYNSANIIYHQRQGAAAVEGVENGNKYFTFEQEADYVHTADQGPYLSQGIGTYLSGESNYSSATAITDYKYFVVDFDLYYPEGIPMHNSTVMVMLRYLDNNKTGKTLGAHPSAYFRIDGGKNTTLVNANWTLGTKAMDASDEWRHVTLIVEPNVVDNRIQFTTYLVIDGVIHQIENALDIYGSLTSDNFYNGDMTKIFTSEIRLNFGNATTGKNAYDNYTVRGFGQDYDDTAVSAMLAGGTGASLMEWDGNLYDPTDMPLANPTCEIDGVKYDTVRRALEVAKTGDTITIIRDTDETVTLPAAGIALATRGYSVGTVSVASGLTLYKIGDNYKAYVTGTIVDKKTMDFEAVNAGTQYVGGKNTAMQHNYTFIGQSGGANTGTVKEENGNKYVDLVWGTPTAVVNPYIMNSGVSSSPTVEASHTNHSLYTIDLDVRFPAGKVINGTKVGFEHRKLVDGASTYAGCGDFYLKFYNSANGVYLAYSQNAEQKYYLDSSIWTHITMAVTADTVGTVHTLTMHLFLNGEYMGSPYSFTIDNEAATFTYVRFSMQDNTDAATTQDCEVYIDNYTVRFYKSSYDRTGFDSVVGAGSNLTDWSDHLYYEDSVPCGEIVATNGEKSYDRLQKAIDEAEDGDTINLVKSVNTVVKATSKVTIVLGGNTIGGIQRTEQFIPVAIDGGYVIVDIATSEIAFAYTDDGKECYTADIATAFTNADTGTTVYLLKDVTVQGPTNGNDNIHDLLYTVTISNNTTGRFDMGGHTLKLAQNEQNPLFFLGGSAKLYVSNGTIMAARSNYGNATYPIIFISGGASVYLTDVNTYGGSTVYNNGGLNCYVEITGGEHYATNSPQGTQGNGMFASTGELDVKATDALFFIDDSGSLISSTSRKKEESYTSVSSFCFEGCTIIADPATPNANIVKYANINTSIEFVGCEIVGSINPEVYSNDTVGSTSTTWAPIDAGSIIMGEGTRYDNTKTLIGGGVIVAADGYTITSEQKAASYTVNDSYDSMYDKNFAIQTSTVNANLTSVVEKITVKIFSYVNGGIEMYTGDLVEALTNADEGTVITMLMDYELTSTAHNIMTISGTKTLDLGTFTFTLYQGGQTCFYINGSFTMKNGTFRAVRTDNPHTDGNSYQDRTYPALYVSGANTTITLDNIVAYGGALVSSSQANTTVIVNGGEYYSVQAVQGGWGGIFDLRHTSTLKADDALFFVDSSSWVVTDASRYTKGADHVNTYTFTNCKLISDPDDSGNLVKYANQYTRIYFNDCDIVGDINPTVHRDDVTYANGAYTSTKYEEIGAGSIVFGVGTRYDSTKTFIGGVITTPDGYIIGREEIDTSYSVVDINDTPFTDGEYVYTERDIQVVLSAVVASEFNYHFSYYAGGNLYYTNDYAEAFTDADSGSVVTFVKDFELWTDADSNVAPILNLKTSITIDLNGHVFSVVQAHQSTFYVYANITFMNGEIRAVCDDTANDSGTKYTDKTFPLFTMTANKTITFNNVNTYTGALLISRANNVTININGGEHHVTHHDTASSRGSWGGLVEMRGVTNFNATNSIFFVDRSGWIISSSSTYVDMNAAAAARLSTYTFVGCTLISDPNDSDGTYHLIKHADENTKLVFDNCNIFGSVNPTPFASDYKGNSSENGLWGNILAENIIFKEGTRIATGAKGTIFSFANYSFESANYDFIDENMNMGIVITLCNDKPYSDGYVFNKDTYFFVFDKVVADTVNITITYHYPDGSTGTESYANGTVVTTFPSYDVPNAVDNGWVKVTYAGGWSLTGYGEKIDSLTVTGRIHLYPAATEARAYLSSGMYNLSLYGNVGANILIPDIEYRPEGIVLVGVYDMDGNEISLFASGIVAKGRTYSSYEAGRTDVISLDTPVMVRVKYTFYNIEFTQTVTLNPLDYVKLSLTNSNTNPEAKTLLSDMIVYADALNKYAKRDSAATVAVFEEIVGSTGLTLYEIAEQYKSTLADPSVFDEQAEFNDGKGLIESISFNVGGADPSYVIYFAEGTRVVDVKFVMKNAYVSNLPGYDRGNVTYGTDESKSVYTTEDGFDVLSMAHSEGISIYNLAMGEVEFILTVLDDNGGGHTVIIDGKYNLANYYHGIAAGGSFTEADITRAKAVLIALNTYGTSSAIYRFGSINAGEVSSNIVNVYYEDFGAKGDGTTDDFTAIYNAHKYANQQKDAGRNVTVYAIKPGGTIPEGATFRLVNTDSAGELYGCYAEIRTDVVWTGANFIFDDSGLNNDNYKIENVYGKSAFITPLFKVMPDNKNGDNPFYTTINNYTDNGGTLLTSDTHIDSIKNLSLPFEWALVRVYNTQHAHYYRYGANASSTIQQEVIRVNTKTGEIDPMTPLSHDYLYVSSLRIYDASSETITIRGGSITTLYNQVDSYDYSNRGVFVARSNTVIKGVDNSYSYSDWNNSGVTHGSPMQFFNFQYVHGAVIDDCDIEGPKVFYDKENENGVGSIMRGSYTIRADQTSSLTISNMRQRNFYHELNDATRGKTPDGMVDHQAVMGSNFCKNLLFENNMMTTFDSHSGIENLVVRGCEVERINVIGQGKVIVEDTIIHTGVTHSAIVLREDYNSNFKGDVYFKNVTLETYNEGYVGLFWMSFRNYNTGLYYADGETFTVSGGESNNSYYSHDTNKDGNDDHYYASYLPENVYIDGLTILSGGSISAADNYYGGTYNKGNEDTGVTLALYCGYTISENFTELIKMVHNWDCDISTYGSNFKKWEGNLFQGTFKQYTYTVKHPIKPTETIFVDSTTSGKYTINDYVYGGTVYNSLQFLDGLVQTGLPQ